MAMVTATFRNSSIFRNRWTIKDGNSSQVVFDSDLEPRGENGSEVNVNMTPGNTGKGEVYYKHEGQSVFTHKSFIENGDTVDLY